MYYVIMFVCVGLKLTVRSMHYRTNDKPIYSLLFKRQDYELQEVTNNDSIKKF